MRKIEYMTPKEWKVVSICGVKADATSANHFTPLHVTMSRRHQKVEIPINQRSVKFRYTRTSSFIKVLIQSTARMKWRSGIQYVSFTSMLHRLSYLKSPP